MNKAEKASKRVLAIYAKITKPQPSGWTVKWAYLCLHPDDAIKVLRE
jgi:hypothetical protein